MANKTRKRLWPVSLVMAVAVVGVVAAFLMMASSPTNTQAHDGASGSTHCDDLGFIGSIAHDEDPNNDHDCATGPTAPPPIDPTDPMAPDAKVTSSSTSASSGPELQLTIGSLPMAMAVGSSIVLYLEDDFAEPDSISASSVYIVATGGDQDEQLTTGDGSRVYVTIAPKLKTNDYFDPDKDDISVQVLVPDMCPNATGACEGDDGLHMGQTVTVVIESDSGIKNPPEEGTHFTGYDAAGAQLKGLAAGLRSPISTRCALGPRLLCQRRGQQARLRDDRRRFRISTTAPPPAPTS